MLKIENLSKTYKNGKKAVDDLSLTVNAGEIFGFIGPNGAGKTTTIKSIVGILEFDAGQIFIDGLSVKTQPLQCKQITAYIPDNPDLYEYLTGLAYINFVADIFGVKKDEREPLLVKYADLLDLKADLANPISSYSHGMKQKLALSCALIHKPEILILDEPTTGVDPVSRKEFWDMLARLKEQGLIILVSTAYMDEAGRCDRIALIKEGEFIATDTPQGIIDNYSGVLWAVQGSRMSVILHELRAHHLIKSSFAFGDKIHITVDEGLQAEELKQYLINKNFEDVNVFPIEPTVEDCFMALTN